MLSKGSLACGIVSIFAPFLHDFLTGKRKIIADTCPAINPRSVVFAAGPGFLNFAHFSDFIRSRDSIAYRPTTCSISRSSSVMTYSSAPSGVQS